MTFHPRRRNLIRTLPQLLLDEKNTEDVSTKGDDHGVDALRYALSGWEPRPPDDSAMREPHNDIFPGIDPLTGKRKTYPWDKTPPPRFTSGCEMRRRPWISGIHNPTEEDGANEHRR
jgi:hypothetical protein